MRRMLPFLIAMMLIMDGKIGFLRPRANLSIRVIKHSRADLPKRAA